MATNTHISVRGAHGRRVIVVALTAALAAAVFGNTVTNSGASGRAEATACLAGRSSLSIGRTRFVGTSAIGGRSSARRP